MSNTYLPMQIRKDLWIAAAGRCEFRGCNKPINRNFITQEHVLLGEYCHIISDSPTGPRGDKNLSEDLSTSADNLMLCCPTCHKTIDDSALVGTYNIELLREMKIAHEHNIQKIYDATDVRNGVLLIVISKINNTISQITYKLSQYAVLQNSNYSIFPVYPPEIINLSSITYEESSPAFYQAAKEKIQYRISSIIDRMCDWEIEHLDVFALAQIPILTYLGYVIGDRLDCTIYQAQRNSINKWLWPKTINPQRPKFSYTVLPDDRTIEIIAIVMSISAKINHEDVFKELGHISIVDFFVDNPTTEVVDSPDVQRDFSTRFRLLMSIIFEKHSNAEVHIFSAIPNSLAIEMGRCINPHALNKTWLWNRINGVFIKALCL